MRTAIQLNRREISRRTNASTCSSRHGGDSPLPCKLPNEKTQCRWRSIRVGNRQANRLPTVASDLNYILHLGTCCVSLCSAAAFNDYVNRLRAVRVGGGGEPCAVDSGPRRATHLVCLLSKPTGLASPLIQICKVQYAVWFGWIEMITWKIRFKKEIMLIATLHMTDQIIETQFIPRKLTVTLNIPTISNTSNKLISKPECVNTNSNSSCRAHIIRAGTRST